jgi:acyl carrier protein
MNDRIEQFTEFVCKVGKIPPVGPDDDFYGAGFSSIKALELLVELESTYSVSIPDDQFILARTSRELHAIVTRLAQESAA